MVAAQIYISTNSVGVTQYNSKLMRVETLLFLQLKREAWCWGRGRKLASPILCWSRAFWCWGRGRKLASPILCWSRASEPSSVGIQGRAGRFSLCWCCMETNELLCEPLSLTVYFVFCFNNQWHVGATWRHKLILCFWSQSFFAVTVQDAEGLHSAFLMDTRGMRIQWGNPRSVGVAPDGLVLLFPMSQEVDPRGTLQTSGMVPRETELWLPRDVSSMKQPWTIISSSPRCDLSELPNLYLVVISSNGLPACKPLS